MKYDLDFVKYTADTDDKARIIIVVKSCHAAKEVLDQLDAVAGEGAVLYVPGRITYKSGATLNVYIEPEENELHRWGGVQASTIIYDPTIGAKTLRFLMTRLRGCGAECLMMIPLIEQEADGCN